MNETLVHRKTINCTKRIQKKEYGTIFNRLKGKWENKVGGK